MDSMVQLLWIISWQVILLAMIVWAISRLAWKAPASWRYILWLILLVKFFVPPFVHIPTPHLPAKLLALPIVSTTPTAIPEDNIKPSQSDKSRPSAAHEVSNKPTVIDAAQDYVKNTRPSILYLEGAVTVLWLAGFGFMLTQLITRKRRQNALMSNSLLAGEGLTEFLANSCSHLGMFKAPEIRLSEEVYTPMVIGLFKPAIIFPTKIKELYDKSDLKAMMLHELAHLKRHDMWAIWLYQIALLIFFFHPVVWLLGRELKKERELACDELVIGLSVITREEYANGYVTALKMSSGIPLKTDSLAMAEPFEIEKQRILLILRKPVGKANPWLLALLFLVALIGLPTISSTAGNDYDLAEIQAEIDNSYASTRSGKGTILIQSSMPGGSLQTNTLCYSTFSDGEFKLLVDDEYTGNQDIEQLPMKPDESKSTVLAYDGQILTEYKPEDKSAMHGDLASNFAVAELDKYQNCYPGQYSFGPSMGFGIPTSYLANPNPSIKSRTRPKIIGREIIDDDECVVIDFEDMKIGRNGEDFKRITRQWINPEKGFCASRIYIWNEEEDRGRILISTANSDLSQYDDGVWRASRTTITNYRSDPNTHKSIESFRTIITYSPNFKFNVPVSGDELELTLPPGTLMQEAESR